MKHNDQPYLEASTPAQGPTRRGMLATAFAAAGTGLAAASAQGASATAANAGSVAAGRDLVQIDQSCRVPAALLDAMVAAVFKRFNHPAVLPDFSADRHGARHDVDLHRLITHVTLPLTGETVAVTGLLALPVGVSGPLPVVSWQHGTILSFDQVPSNMVKLKDPTYQMTDEQDSLETLFNIHRLAAQGYAVIAADYVGKGPLRKGRAEAYAVKEVTVATCVRILDAGLAAMRSLKATPGPLFLNGWSQGAANTQWLHQELQRRRRAVTASAVHSPFNEFSEAWRFWAGVQTFPVPEGMSAYPAAPDWISLCMTLVLGSFQTYYRLDGLLKSAVRPEFHDLVAKYWNDYKLDFDPVKPFPTGRTLLVPGFFDRFTDERNSALLRQMASNVAAYHRYDAPIRFYYGLADEAIHPVMVTRALAAGGAKVAGVPVAGGSHRGTFISALYGDGKALAGQENVVDWFNRLRA